MSVGVKKALVPYAPRGVDKPAPSVMATNSNPIRVAAAVPAIMKKLSQAWSIGILKNGSRAIYHVTTATVRLKNAARPSSSCPAATGAAKFITSMMAATIGLTAPFMCVALRTIRL